MLLHIDIRKKTATYQKHDGDIVCGNEDYKIQFTFDSEWDAHDKKKARVVYNNTYKDVSIDKDGVCALPKIRNTTMVQVGVFSNDGKLRTTTPAYIRCRRSILCGAEDMESAPENDKEYATEALQAAERAEASATRAETLVADARESATRAETLVAEADETLTELRRAKDNGEFEGADGKTSYEHAKEGGYLGTEEEFNEKLATDYIDWFGVGISIPENADLNTYKTNGKYYCNSESRAQTLLNRPPKMNTNFVMWVFSRTTSTIKSQLILTLTGKMYLRSSSSSAWRSWSSPATFEEIEELTEAVKNDLVDELRDHGVVPTVKSGLTVAVVGDSISTFYGENANEMEIVAEDVGVPLSSYITYYDIGKTISKNGVTSNYTITADDVGNEIKIVPCADDVGKKLGEPKNYNTSSKTEKTWWRVAADALGFEPVVAAWSGSSITAHESAESNLKCSHAWHNQTIRKLGKRIPGSMNRIAPDVVLIYRGTNDLSHSTKVRLTSGYFDTVDWTYPETDVLNDGATYGYIEGLALTIQKIRTTYPRARIALCTCTVFKRSNYAHFPTHNGYFSIPQMNNAIRETADFFGCHVIELDKCGITWENCYDEGYITDDATKPTHPNTSGHALMGQQAICDLIHRLHISDIEPSFDEIEFIPKDEPENLIALGTFIDGNYIDKGSGDLVSAAQYFSYTDIPVESGESYLVPRLRNYAFYDANGAYVTSGGKSGDANAVVVAPSNVSTLGVCFRHSDSTPENVSVTKQVTVQ